MDRCTRIIRSCYHTIRIRPNALRLTLCFGSTSFYGLDAAERKYLQRHGDMKAVDYAVYCHVRYYQPTRALYIPDDTPRGDSCLVPQIEPYVAPGPVQIHSPRQAWIKPVEGLWRGPMPRPESNPFTSYQPTTTALQHLAIRLAALATTEAHFHDPDHAIYLYYHPSES